MADDILPSGKAYTYTLLNKWEEIMKLSESFRQDFLQGRLRSSVYTEYISKITRMWLELYPKVKDNSSFSELAARFQEYEELCLYPSLFMRKGNRKKIFALELLLRETLEKLNITTYEEKT